MKFLIIISIFLYGLAAGHVDMLGGLQAHIGTAPYMASLRDADNNHICGGAVIAPTWIVTSAECANLTTAVHVGSNSLSHGGDYYEAARTIQHEDFVADGDYKNDIGLIQTFNEFELSKFVQPVQLYSGFVEESDTLKLTRWGRLEDQMPDSLQELHVIALTTEECQELTHFSPETALCTANYASSGDCVVEAGSPLTLRGKLAAIAQSSTLNGCDFHPGYYTRISMHIDWIYGKLLD